MGFSLTLIRLLVLASALAVAEVTSSIKGSNISYPVSLNGIHLKTASAKLIATALENGTIKSLDLVDAYLQRLAANDQKGNRTTLSWFLEPARYCATNLADKYFLRTGLALHSFIEIGPTVLEIARGLDAERASGNVRSAIHGLPIVVKDGMYSCHCYGLPVK